MSVINSRLIIFGVCGTYVNLSLRNNNDKQLFFAALLIEHSFSRHLYNSMEHLTRLLASSDMRTVLAVLNLLYVFSKRSNFITRLCAQRYTISSYYSIRAVILSEGPGYTFLFAKLQLHIWICTAASDIS